MVKGSGFSRVIEKSGLGIPILSTLSIFSLAKTLKTCWAL